MGFKTDSIASYIGIITGIIGTITLFQSHPFLAGIAIILIISGISWLLFVKYFYSHLLIKRGIKQLLQKLKDQNFVPDVLVAFSRSGATVAGMISVNLGIQELLVISRKLIDSKKVKQNSTDRFLFTPYTKLNPEELNKRKLLVVFMVIDTADTLKAGLDFLKDHEINVENVQVATICISPGARRRWNNVIFSYETTKIESFLDHLPWIIEGYHHI